MSGNFSARVDHSQVTAKLIADVIREDVEKDKKKLALNRYEH